jgi:hypothetical protein
MRLHEDPAVRVVLWLGVCAFCSLLVLVFDWAGLVLFLALTVPVAWMWLR